MSANPFAFVVSSIHDCVATGECISISRTQFIRVLYLVTINTRSTLASMKYALIKSIAVLVLPVPISMKNANAFLFHARLSAVVW